MNAIDSVLTKRAIPSYIIPLFWQHGEDEDILRNEIRQMHANGIGGFVVESRPHPDFLGPRWWHDLDLIVDEARQRNMKVWLFDDSHFPSGFAGGKIRDHHPEYLKVYLDERHVDAVGPLKGSSFVVKAWLEDREDKLVAVVAARRTDGGDAIDGDSLVELTDRVTDGILYWEVPEGRWRIFILFRTRNGGEDTTRDYLNPIEPEPVQAFIKYVYEAHYERYGAEFGRTIAGFFSDESRLGNAHTCDGTLGYTQSWWRDARIKMVLPFSDRLLSRLDVAWGGRFAPLLPCLWYDAGPLTSEARFVYMDVVSDLFGRHYSMQIGDWCRAHGVKYMGHLVEDNGAHARLGYGTGHFYRGLSGQDYAGLDIVYHVWPEYTYGIHSTQIGEMDVDFFYWGITKLASSAGHLDPKKNGTTVCEIFGAYGWQLGLKTMKWLTDHVCVRGVNILIPHAFTPKANDPDCPPHFYAAGNNPQWRYFHLWSAYANRVCHLLSGGRHVAPVAVIYHAEAEWAGKYMPFERVVKALAVRQIDCDVVPIDLFIDPGALTIAQGRIAINGETFKAVVVPYAEKLPAAFVDMLAELARSDIPVFFMEDLPAGASRASGQFARTIGELKISPNVHVCSDDELAGKILEMELSELTTSSLEENLRSYHYVQGDEHLFFLTNESRNAAIRTELAINAAEGIPVLYDALEDRAFAADFVRESGIARVELQLQPFESLFILFKKDGVAVADGGSRFRIDRASSAQQIVLDGEWTASTSPNPEYAAFVPQPLIRGLGNISVPSVLPEFSGTVRYETTVELDRDVQDSGGVKLDLGDVYELAEVWINGNRAGTRICPPYVTDIKEWLVAGTNSIRVDVTNTLAKQLGNNLLDRSMPQEPSGLLGPVRLIIHDQAQPLRARMTEANEDARFPGERRG